MNPFPAGTMDAVEFDADMAEERREREVQRELDGDTWDNDAIEAARAADTLRAYDERSKRADAPIPQPCHHCTHLFAGAVCNLCGTERPAYTALKASNAVRVSNDRATAASGDALTSDGTHPRRTA